MTASPPASGLATERLERYLRERLTGVHGTLSCVRATGGLSNPTYFLGAGDWSAVLRKQPGTAVLHSAHSIDREFRILSALQDSAVPVPRPLLYCEDATVVGTPFYLMDRLHGRVFSEYATPALTTVERAACYDSMCRTMAAIHGFDWHAAGLADFGRSGNYFARQLKRWSDQWQRFRTPDNPFVDRLTAWLTEHMPSSDTTAVCHGDFRMANVMFHATEPRVIGVLDWELSTLGHPLADVAFNVQAWRMTPAENGGILGLDLSAMGIPEENAYLEMYYRYANSRERMTTFHMAFAMFRAAVGVAGVAARGEAAKDAATAAEGRRLSLAYAARGVEAMQREA